MKLAIEKYLAVSLAAALFYAPALAQTPDEETPAEETICADLKHATPGLYGLCIAYCEAQDLASVDSEDIDAISKMAPKFKILANYEKKRIIGDPPMPCVEVPVPCWSPDELALIGTRPDSGFQTLRHQRWNCPDVRIGETWYIEQQHGQGGQLWAGAWYRTLTGEQGCWFFDLANGIRRAQYITLDEYDAAQQAIYNRAVELGWSEYPWNTFYPEHAPCPVN